MKLTFFSEITIRGPTTGQTYRFIDALDFSASPTINHPKSPGVFLPGIPRCAPLRDLFTAENDSQLALLHLCIFSETLCWRKLFNVAFEAYIQGELNLHRFLPVEHVDLIYQRTHSESKLREFVLDSISLLKGEDDHLVYLPLAKKHEEFLENVFQKLGDTGCAIGSIFDDEGICRYHMHAEGKECARVEDGVFARRSSGPQLGDEAVRI